MSDEQLPHLETFARAAELSSFTAAARDLGITQAAVSQRVRALEQELDVALFERQGGHVLLTDAGRRLHEYARRILALHRGAREEITGEKVPLAGEITLAASSVPGEHLLPAVLAAFRRRHEHIQARVTVTDTKAVLEQVERGAADLGLVGGKSDNPHLEFRSFACDKMVLVAPAGHAWAKRKRVTLKQLADRPLVLREAGSGSRWCLEAALRAAGKSLSELRVAAELGSNEAIKEAVERGLGLAVLSTHVVRKELRDGTLHALEVTDLPLRRDIYVVRDRRRVLSIPAQLFLDFLEPCPRAKSRS
jgi:DNA-binding transcriptional LysR family regulator